MTATADGAMRLDKWLWCARFFKSRSLAAKLCAGSRVRRNRRLLSKPSATVRIGDVLTFPQGSRVRVVRVRALAARRGPAAEAVALFDDLSPPAARPAGARAPGAGRPTKAERRAFERLRDREA